MGKPVEGLTGAFIAVKKSRNIFGFVIHLYLNDDTFTSSQRRYIKGSRVGPRGGGTSPHKTLLTTLLVAGGVRRSSYLCQFSIFFPEQ